MFIRLMLSICCLSLAFSANAIRYEVLTKGSDLLIKEVDEFVLVGSDVLAPIKLPYKEAFTFLDATGSGYNLSSWANSTDISSWTRSDAIVFKGNFLDGYAGDEWFIQGKGIAFSGGAKNAYVNGLTYIADTNHTYSSAIAAASSSQLTMVTVGSKEYLQYDTTSIPTIRYRAGESYQIIAENIGSVQAASDETLIKAPVSSVTSAGTFTSSYPIEFPAAEGGLKPSLAISYMSNGPKNGLLGYGFALSGIETITHCPFNTDSKAGNYKKGNLTAYKDETQFCYGGKALIALSNSTGGEQTGPRNGALMWYSLKSEPKYRFELQNETFTLHMPDHSIKTFEKINDITWALSELTNVYGNAISYSYVNTASEISQPQVNNISWGDYTASFIYSNKRNDFDIEVDMLGDNFFSEQKLLTNIEIKNQGVNLINQKIQYELLEGFARYVINAIQSCGKLPSEACSQPVEFQWSNMGQLLEISSNTSTSGVLDKIVKIKASNSQAEQVAYIDGNTIKEIDGTTLINFPAYGGEELVQVYPYRENGMDTLYLLFKSEYQVKTLRSDPNQPVNEWNPKGGYTCANYFPHLDGSDPTSVLTADRHERCDTKFGSSGAKCGGDYTDDYRRVNKPTEIQWLCALPYTVINQVKYTWHKVNQNSTATGWLPTTSKILEGGCFEGGAIVSDSFSKSAPMLSMDKDSDGIQDVLLRTLTKNGAETTDCMAKGDESTFEENYAVYADGSTYQPVSFQAVGNWSRSVINDQSSSTKSYSILSSSSENSSRLQSDIDGNGLDDYLLIEGNDSDNKTVKVYFTGRYEWEKRKLLGMTIWEGNRAQTEVISYSLGTGVSDNLIPIDIDHDGIKEILYAQNGSIKYLKYRYNPIESAVNLSSHTLISSLGTVEKLLLADTNNNGFQELVVGLASSVKTFELPRRPVVNQVDYGIYRDVITYDDSAVTLDSTNTSGQPVTKPTYQVVSKFQKQFKDSDDVYEDLSRVSYSYLNPAIHTQHGYSLGFEKITKTDGINLAKTETTYYQDVLKRGLVKDVLNQSQVYGSYKNISRVENTYKQHSLHNLGLGLDESKKTSYIKGIASNYTKQTYDYDDYARVTSVNNQLYSSSHQLIQSSLVSTQYKNTSFAHGGTYDILPDYVDSTLTIPVGSPLINQRNAAGSKTMRKVYTESIWTLNTIEKVTSGYLDADGAFVQTSANSVEQRAGEKGNVSKTTQYGKVDEAYSITTEFSSYVGSQPQIIRILNGKGSTSHSYDQLGRKLTETTPNGSLTAYTYDAFGRVLTLDSSRDDAAYSYASCANDSACTSLPNSSDIAWVSEVSWASGKKESSYTDAQGRNVGQAWQDALGRTMYSWKTFDSRNRVSKEYLPCAQGSCAADSPHTAYSYEANSADRWQVKKTLADGSIVKTTIKAGSCATTLGSSSICVNSSGAAVTPYYTQETLVDGKQPKLNTEGAETPSTPTATTHKTYQVFDHAGNAFASVEGSGNGARAVVFSRDVMGNNTQVHQRFGNESTEELVRSYAYTDAGELKSDTNAVGVKEEYRFNGFGDLVGSYVFGADGKLYGYDFYRYDTIGRLKDRHHSYSNSGETVTVGTDGTYSYGALSTGRTYMYSYTSNYGITVPDGFDCLGVLELCSELVTDNITNTKSYKNYSYTDDGLLDGKFETITDSNASVTKNAEFSYGYFPSGQLQTESLNGYEITHQYAYGQLTQMTDHHAETLWKLHDLAINGSVEEAKILGTNDLLYTPDVLGRNSISTALDANGVSINSWAQGFNHVGTAAFRQSLTDINDPAPSKAENFEYDGFGQLDQTEMAGANPYDYTIDKWANLTARRGVNTDYSTLASNCATQMSSSGVNSLPARSGSNKWLASSRGSQQYCYDQLGRQAISGDNAIEYYVNGQAARIKNAQSDIRLGYDSQGTPNFEQQTSTDTTKNYTAWLFDGGRYEVRDDSGTLNTRIYPSHDIRVDYAGEGVGSSPTYRYVLTDTMGSALGLATKNGNALTLTDQRGYTPFGEHRTPDNWNIISTVDTGDAYGFTGQRHLPEFGLYQFVGRIYDTDQGRFTGPDPIVSQPGNWKNYNPYAYVYNDPMGWTDPSGWSGVDVNIQNNQLQQLEMQLNQQRQAQQQYNAGVSVVSATDYTMLHNNINALTQFNNAMHLTTTLNSMYLQPNLNLSVQQPQTAASFSLSVMEGVHDNYFAPLGVVGELAFAFGDVVVTPLAEGYQAWSDDNYSGAAWAVAGAVMKKAEVAYDLVENLNSAKKAGKSGDFSIIDWSGYPSGPKPEGTFRMLEGSEYQAARKAANSANRKLHRADSTLKGKQLHEIKPVKFGGSPTAGSNKIPLSPREHAEYTKYWNRLQRDLNK